MSVEYIPRITRISVSPKGDPIFSEMVTHVEIDDEAGGEYVKIRQQSGSVDAKEQEIQITPEEWSTLRSAIDETMENIKQWEKSS